MSVGGGGGSGGDVTLHLLGILLSASRTAGGVGGAGGDGNVVNVTSGSTITTEGEHSHGLLAESIGGGGGSGGNASSWIVNVPIPFTTLPTINVAVSLGGSGGDGGQGRAVKILNSQGDISTSKFRSSGILAQSVGGGGGNGGDSMVHSYIVNGYSLSTAIGGSGGLGGDGDAVQVANQSRIATQGDYAYGILGQSIGGGGGAGGSSKTALADWNPLNLRSIRPAPDVRF